MEDLFRSYWWLMFPIMGMGMGFFSIFSYFQSRKDTMKLIKSYIDQGKEPPESLIKALSVDEVSGHYPRRRYRSGRSTFSSFIVFAALATAFSFVGWTQEHFVFQALGIGFGVAAVGTLILALFSMGSNKDSKGDPKD